MNLFYVKNDYIDYLKLFDEKVRHNKNGRRPYIGIILQINNFNYFAPLCSPKEKYIKMKNKIDLIKLDEGRLGVININNMIPLADNTYSNIDLRGIEDRNYRILLTKQLITINNKANEIENCSMKLYRIIKSNDQELTSFKKNIKDRCCNLSLLEQKVLNYA